MSSNFNDDDILFSFSLKSLLFDKFDLLNDLKEFN